MTPETEPMTPPAPNAAHGPLAGGPRGIDRLLRLQDSDTQTDRLLARRDQLEGGADVRTAREQQARMEAALGELKLSIDAAATQQLRMESDVDALDRKRKDEEKRLYDGSVANARELQSIRAEVESLAGRKGRLEDRLLEVMETREELQRRMGPMEHEAAETRAALEGVLQSDASELDQIDATLSRLATDRQALLPSFDPVLLTLYEDLRRQKKGVGAAALKDSVCDGCHQKLSPMEMDRLKHTSGVKRCEYCRRILAPA